MVQAGRCIVKLCDRIIRYRALKLLRALVKKKERLSLYKCRSTDPYQPAWTASTFQTGLLKYEVE